MSSNRLPGLLGFGAYVPERVMSNEEWARHVDTTDAWITERTGIKRRHFAEPGDTTLTLAARAARDALRDAGLVASDVDEIILATDTPEVLSPDTASFVQHEIGAGPVPAYDLGGSGCAGFLQGIDVACSRVLTGKERVLVIGVELASRVLDWSDRATAVLFGDGAGAAVVGRGGREILASINGTDGSRAAILGRPIGGTRTPITRELVEQGKAFRLAMEGREVFKVAVARMSEAGARVLEMAGRAASEVNLLVPHQANLRILDAVGKALGIHSERVFVDVDEYGNTGSASIPLALWDARRQGRLHDGELVLLVAFGAGFHWAASLVQF